MSIVRLLISAALACSLASSGSAAEDHVRDQLVAAKPVWYDAARDDWRRVEVIPPRVSAPQNTGTGAGSSVALPATILAYALAAAALVLLGWLVWLVVRGGRALVIEQRLAEAAPLRRADISALAFAPREGQADPEGALAAALRARDWSLAVIWLYTLMLLRLDRAGALRLAPGKTNGTYRAETKRAAPLAAAALGDGIALFERSYFGHLPVSEQEVEGLARRRKALEAAVANEKQG